MEAKEKAKELVDNFQGLAHSDFHNQTGYDESQRDENAKQCALIAVDEIISVLNGNHIFNAGIIEYLQEVKTEINNL